VFPACRDCRAIVVSVDQLSQKIANAILVEIHLIRIGDCHAVVAGVATPSLSSSGFKLSMHGKE